MAGFKVSEFSGVADTTDDSLLLLSYTTDNGANYATRKIRIADFLDDIPPTTKADLDVDDIETMLGAPGGPGAVNLGTFPGDVIPDNSTVYQALLLLEQNVELKQDALTAGDGLDLTADTLSVDLHDQTESYTDLTLTASGGGTTLNLGLDAADTNNLTLKVRASGGASTITITGGTIAVGDTVRIYDDSAVAWVFEVESINNSAAWQNDLTAVAGTVARDGVSVTDFVSGAAAFVGNTSISGPNSTLVDLFVAGYTSYLAIEGGQLKVTVLDEDDMASNSASHVPTQQSVKSFVEAQDAISATAAAATYLRIDGATTATGDLDMGGNLVSNQADPISGSDSATKSYVDSATAGQGAFWQPVDLHADSNITLSGEQTIDGVLTSSSRVLASGQTAQSDNGIYVTGAGAWIRDVDADESGEFLTNKTVFVKFGDTESGHVEAYIGSDNPVLGTDTITFVTKSEAATLADGSITTAKIANLAVTDAKVNDVAASKLTGTLDDATVAETNVTQHEAALSIAFTQVTGSADDSQIAETNVTQHQAALSLTKSQISDFSDADYTSAGQGVALTIEQGSIRQSLGTASGDTSMGTFTGSTLGDTETVKSALQVLETTIEGLTTADLTDGGDVVQAGDNVDRLIGSTGADGEPATYLFLVCDQSDGSIKFIDKQFIELE